jgi:hypothetical protein
MFEQTLGVEIVVLENSVEQGKREKWKGFICDAGRRIDEAK